MKTLTSVFPWHIVVDGKGAIVKDARGDEIGRFNDYSDAEVVVSRINGHDGKFHGTKQVSS